MSIPIRISTRVMGIGEEAVDRATGQRYRGDGTTAGGVLITDSAGSPATVADPVFSPNGSLGYSGELEITLTCATAGASIRYLRSAGSPTETEGILYTGPFTVRGTETIQAVAYKPGLVTSDVVSATFTKLVGSEEVIVWPEGEGWVAGHRFTQTPYETDTWSTHSTGTDGMRVFGTNQWHRVPCDMDITKWRARNGNNATPLTDCRLEIWRRRSATDTYDRVAVSENLYAQIPTTGTPSVIEVTLATPLTAQCDDVVCAYGISTVAVGFLQTLSGGNVTGGSHRYVGEITVFTDVTLEARANDQVYPIQLYGTIPQAVCIGDSQAEGERGYDELGGARRSVAGHLTALSGLRVVHRAVGSQASNQVLLLLTAFSGAVGTVEFGMPLWFCPGAFGLGNNLFNISDPGDPVEVAAAKASYLADVITFLDTIVTTNDWYVVMCGANPGGYTDALSALRRDWNASLATLCASYQANRVLYLDMDETLGKLRVATGELDDFKDGFGSDTYHMSDLGDQTMAAHIWDSFETWAASHGITYA